MKSNYPHDLFALEEAGIWLGRRLAEAPGRRGGAPQHPRPPGCVPALPPGAWGEAGWRGKDFQLSGEQIPALTTSPCTAARQMGAGRLRRPGLATSPHLLSQALEGFTSSGIGFQNKL